MSAFLLVTVTVTVYSESSLSSKCHIPSLVKLRFQVPIRWCGQREKLIMLIR